MQPKAGELEIVGESDKQATGYSKGEERRCGLCHDH